MAYGYYPNMFNQGYQPPVYPQQAQNNGIIWVQGEAGAKGYPVAPGSNVLLMDSEAKTMYLKGADSAGMPYMRIFDYVERTNQPAPEQPQKVDYVTREEFGKLVDIVNGLKGGATNE